MDGNTIHPNLIQQTVFRVRDPISALTHFIAFLAAILATPVLLVHAAWQRADLSTLISLGIFMISMVLLYGASTAYHSFSLTDRGNRVLKKLDHTMIFLLIAGSYTPVCVVSLRGMVGFQLLTLVWSFAAAGVIFKLCWVTCPKWVSSVIYIAMGWLCVTAMPQILSELSAAAFGWLLAGGLSYTVGGVVYAIKPRALHQKAFGPHEVFHLFVMGGSLCHFIFMYGYLL